MFIDNKYKKWHDSIIDRAKNRVLSCYVERHHIIPKSCGGSNDKDNLVPLTAREHYIVHMLLPFCVIKKYKLKMIKGFMYMNVKPKNSKRLYKINSRMYEKFRIEFGKMLKGTKLSEEQKAKMRGRKLSKETKAKIKYARQFQVCSDEQRKKYSKIFSNLIWVNFNGKSKRIKKELKEKYLKLGYNLGRSREYLTKDYSNTMKKIVTKIWENRRAA